MKKLTNRVLAIGAAALVVLMALTMVAYRVFVVAT